MKGCGSYGFQFFRPLLPLLLFLGALTTVGLDPFMMVCRRPRSTRATDTAIHHTLNLLIQFDAHSHLAARRSVMYRTV